MALKWKIGSYFISINSLTYLSKSFNYSQFRRVRYAVSTLKMKFFMIINTFIASEIFLIGIQTLGKRRQYSLKFCVQRKFSVSFNSKAWNKKKFGISFFQAWTDLYFSLRTYFFWLKYNLSIHQRLYNS